MKKYYHISPVKNIVSILNEGIKISNGKLFLFDKKDLAATIALNQLFLIDYALFCCEIENNLEKDNVAEWTSSHQFISYKNIPKEKISFVGAYKIKDLNETQS